jgi:hypothetical protein
LQDALYKEYQEVIPHIYPLSAQAGKPVPPDPEIVDGISVERHFCKRLV